MVGDRCCTISAGAMSKYDVVDCVLDGDRVVCIGVGRDTSFLRQLVGC